ncbi:hypothetical protein EDB86DRAFT_2825596 [Lactarius hatsudake]|nr:hypothetical protein EDB86DRAFT_2825596 [Lactarius hatsudake]
MMQSAASGISDHVCTRSVVLKNTVGSEHSHAWVSSASRLAASSLILGLSLRLVHREAGTLDACINFDLLLRRSYCNETEENFPAPKVYLSLVASVDHDTVRAFRNTGQGHEDHARRIYSRRVVPRSGRQGRLAEDLVQDPLAPRIDEVGSCTLRYNTMEQFPRFMCEPGTYHAFLLACPQADVTSTKEKLIPHWSAGTGTIARQIFERWMAWEPDDMAWQAYIKLEIC